VLLIDPHHSDNNLFEIKAGMQSVLQVSYENFHKRFQYSLTLCCVRLEYTEVQLCLLFCMGVKLGLTH